jgi:hypothetical protein
LLPQAVPFEQAQYDFEVTGANDGSTFTLAARGVMPGSYSVGIAPKAGYYVELAKAGGVNLLDQDLLVAPGTAPPPLEIVLRDDGASLTVRAAREGVRVAGTVVIVPVAAEKLIQSQPTDGNSAAQFNNLAPGTYRVLALDATSDAEYQSAAFLRIIAAQGQDVTLAPSQSASLSVELARVKE